MAESILGYLDIIGGAEDDANDSASCMNVGGYPTRLGICKHSMLKFGRNEKECDLVFQDPAVSSIHCVFWAVLFDEDSSPMCYVKDSSLNGTFLNGSLLKRSAAYLLQEGDIIELRDESRKTFKFSSKYQIVNPLLLGQLGFEEIVDQWKVTSRVIGNGTFGHVLVAYKNQQKVEECAEELSKWHPENYAVKIIKLKPNKLDKEAKILLKLNHVCFEDETTITLRIILNISTNRS